MNRKIKGGRRKLVSEKVESNDTIGKTEADILFNTFFICSRLVQSASAQLSVLIRRGSSPKIVSRAIIPTSRSFSIETPLQTTSTPFNFLTNIHLASPAI